MRQSRALTWLCVLLALLVIPAAAVGLFTGGGSGPYDFTTLRGSTATIYGTGLYQYDTLLVGSGFRGGDAVSLFIFVPTLLIGLWLYRLGSLKGGLLLLGALAAILYNYTSMAFAAAYTNFLLLYIPIFSVAFFAFATAALAVDLDLLAARVGPDLPRRTIAGFMFVIAVVLYIVWFGLTWLPSLLAGNGAVLVDSYTTVVTYVLDLGVIAPFAALAGVQLLQRRRSGYLFCAIMLNAAWLIGLCIAGNTVAQVLAGYPYTPGQMIGLVMPFVLMTLVGGWLALRFNRSLRDAPPAGASLPRPPIAAGTVAR